MPGDFRKTEQSSVLEVIRKRYSCRRYSPMAVEPEKLDTLKQAVRWAPSACNRQPYTFHFISDREVLDRISEAVPIGPASANAWMKPAPLIAAAVGSRELVYHRITQVVDGDPFLGDVLSGQ